MELKVTDVVNVMPSNQDGKVVLWFDVVLSGELQICGCKVMNTNGSIWVALPSKQSKKNPKNYFDVVRFVEGREHSDEFGAQCLAMLQIKHKSGELDKFPDDEPFPIG